MFEEIEKAIKTLEIKEKRLDKLHIIVSVLQLIAVIIICGAGMYMTSNNIYLEQLYLVPIYLVIIIPIIIWYHKQCNKIIKE